MDPCPICQTSPCTSELEAGGILGTYGCPRCGKFTIAGTAVAAVLSQKLDARALISHRLRMMQRPGSKLPMLVPSDLDGFMAGRLPTPQEQADNLILWIGDQQASPQAFACTTADEISAIVGAGIVPGEPNGGGWAWLHKQLVEERLYDLTNQGGNVALRLTFGGWKRYHALKHAMVLSRTAFMAMKFNDGPLNLTLRNCLKPAVTRAGFELRLLTEKQPAGLIDNQMRAAIRASRFIVADLTHDNPGAYWEAGFAEGMGLPVFYTCELEKWKKDKTHFDTDHLVTIVWDATNLKKAEDELAATIRATLPAEAKLTDD